MVYPRYWLTLVTLGKTVVACTIARTVNRCGGCLFRPDGYKVVPSYKYPHNLQFTRYNYHKPSKTQQLCEIHQLSINPEKAAISTTYTTYIYIYIHVVVKTVKSQSILLGGIPSTRGLPVLRHPVSPPVLKASPFVLRGGSGGGEVRDLFCASFWWWLWMNNALNFGGKFMKIDKHRC